MALCRNKDTNESRGFAFLAYEDQRSTDIAVDNLNGYSIDGRMISVDHVKDYKRLVDNPDAVHNQQQGDAAPQAQAAAPQALPAGYSAAAPAQSAAPEAEEDGAGPSGPSGRAAGGSSLADMLAEVEEGLVDRSRSWRDRQREDVRRAPSGHDRIGRDHEDPMAGFGGQEKVKKHKREKGEKGSRSKGEKRHAHRSEKHSTREAAGEHGKHRSHKHAMRSSERAPP